MALPKGLNFEGGLYRLRFYHKGLTIFDKCFNDEKTALYYYPKALREKERYLKDFNEQSKNKKVLRLDTLGLIKMLQAA